MGSKAAWRKQQSQQRLNHQSLFYSTLTSIKDDAVPKDYRNNVGKSAIAIKPPRKYYIVVEKINNKWSLQFGDYEKSVAQDEMNELKYAAERNAKANFRCILVNGDTQSAIDAKIVELNAET